MLRVHVRLDFEDEAGDGLVIGLDWLGLRRLDAWPRSEAGKRVETDKQVDLDRVELLPVDEVTAVSRRTEQVETAPSSVTIISKEEIDAFQYPTIYQALVGVPLFHAERSRLSEDLDLTATRSALLPRPTRDRADDDVADDF